MELNKMRTSPTTGHETTAKKASSIRTISRAALMFLVAAAAVGASNANEGDINTIAGIGGVGGFSGDGGAATASQLNAPIGLAVAADGTIYLADTANHRVRKISGGIITTLVGNGTFGSSGNGGI